MVLYVILDDERAQAINKKVCHLRNEADPHYLSLSDVGRFVCGALMFIDEVRGSVTTEDIADLLRAVHMYNTGTLEPDESGTVVYIPR